MSAMATEKSHEEDEMDSKERDELVKNLRIVGAPFSTLDQLASSAANEIERLDDKVEGLLSDLDNAVETAFVNGAYEWTRLNYPRHYERLMGHAVQLPSDVEPKQ